VQRNSFSINTTDMRQWEVCLRKPRASPDALAASRDKPLEDIQFRRMAPGTAAGPDGLRTTGEDGSTGTSAAPKSDSGRAGPALGSVPWRAPSPQGRRVPRSPKTWNEARAGPAGRLWKDRLLPCDDYG